MARKLRSDKPYVAWLMQKKLKQRQEAAGPVPPEVPAPEVVNP